MCKPAFYGVAAWLLTAFICGAEDYPLTFKTIPEKDVMAFPGGSGSYSDIRLDKPDGLNKEPKAISSRPLYGVCAGLRFRLDESKGTGKGYDQLLVDLNDDGNLSDDSVVKETTGLLRARNSTYFGFGPIEAPASKAVCGGRPSYLAVVNLYNLAVLGTENSGNPLVPIGQFRLKAAWYLEGRLEVAGRKQLVGLYDGNGDLTLGTIATPAIYNGPGEANWYFQAGDSFLVDADHSGAFEPNPLSTEFAPFGPILYLGTVPHKASTAADLKMLNLTAWTKPLAEVSLQPNGADIQNLTLARERPRDQWQLLKPGIEAGKLKLPPGNYRLYACGLLANPGKDGAVMASAYQRVPKKPFTFVAGQPNVLKCGAPLEIKVTAEKRKPRPYEPAARESIDATRDSEFILSINATASGIDGEIYSGYASGPQLQDEPVKPTFTVSDAAGKKLASGSLEYG